MNFSEKITQKEIKKVRDLWSTVMYYAEIASLNIDLKDAVRQERKYRKDTTLTRCILADRMYVGIEPGVFKEDDLIDASGGQLVAIQIGMNFRRRAKNQVIWEKKQIAAGKETELYNDRNKRFCWCDARVAVRDACKEIKEIYNSVLEREVQNG
ncbi:MAG: hypothetical protein ACR2NF_12270 [Pirellulales bacterium]